MRLPDAFLARPLAHRGLHDKTAGRPENSPEAFQAAVAAGYGIELDVQLSADGQAMVFHDYDLARLTGESGAVAQRTAADLGRIVLKIGTDTIPTLAQVLALVAGRVPLLIEIKDQDGALDRNVGRLEQATVASLSGYTGPVALMSFNPHATLACAALAPQIARGLVTDPFKLKDWPTIPAATRSRLRGIPDYDAAGCSFVSHNRTDLDAPRIAELKRAGATILCWTVRSQIAEAAARKIADNVTFEGYLA